ncbi:MAG: sugar transporter substrate-binding protein [Firmicutes bacterium]|nr:sugar transporter substrate-binding protein [Bacillota bacterium]
MKGKKLVTLLLCVLLFVTSLTACSSGNSTSKTDTADTTNTTVTKAAGDTSTPASDANAEPVTLTFAIWDKNQQPAMQAMADAFTKLNPNVTISVECSSWGDYWTKLDAAAQGGTLPDVFWMHIAQLSKYVKGNMLAPLDDVLKADNYDLSNFPEALVQGGQMGGIQYGIPKDFDTIGLWYNKELFDAKGVAYPTDSWTWDDMVAAAQKLTDTANGIYGISGGYDSQQTTYNTIPMAGGYVISPDKTKSGYDLPETLNGLQCWVDLIDKYKVSPSQQQLTDTNATAMFESGKVAMVFLGSWMVSEMKTNEYTMDKVDVVSFPSFNGKKQVVINGLTYAMSNTTKNKDVAAKFLEFMGSKDAQSISAQMGAAIPAFNGTQDAWVAATPNLHLQCFIDMTQNAVPYPSDPSMPEWTPVEQQVFPQAWAGQITLQDACKQVADAMNQAIADNAQ